MVNNVDKYMEEAFKEAKKAYLKKEVPVGAIIVKEDKIIARGHNLRETKKNVLAHAEILCINKACKKLKSWRLEGCKMYVTLYPCQMCLGAIKQARIESVYFGALDNNTNDYDKDLLVNMEYKECSKILSDFFKDLRK